MSAPVLLIDADNTLWDTDAVFSSAQLGLLRSVETSSGTACSDSDRLGFVRRFDQAIAARHHAHLKYPPTLLAWALLIALRGASTQQAVTAALKGYSTARRADQFIVNIAVEKYLALLTATPKLLPTVLDGLHAAKHAELPIYILTEGKIERQRDLIVEHQLSHFFIGVFELVKNESQFERLKRRFAPATVVVVGDQPDRDIAPARAAGCAAVLVPGSFNPYWGNATDALSASFTATTFKEAIQWILNCAIAGNESY